MGESVALPACARDSLRPDYVFWGSGEPCLTRGVLPYLRALPRSPATR